MATTVSVIMTVLDGARFIEEAIASVFAQTYSHWELLLVDDGSTDRTPEIVRALAQRHPERVRYFEHPGHVNRGTSASRNLGIANARGDYIAFLDADDVYLPFRLERHVMLLEAHPDIDMVQSDTLRWFSWSDATLRDIRIRWPFDTDIAIPAPGMLRRSFDRCPRDGFFPSVCGVTIRRPAAREIGGFETDFSVCEDWVFFSKLYFRKNVFATTDIVAKYRKHLDSTLHRAQADDRATLLGRYFYIHVAYLRWLKHYLQQNDADPALIKRLCRQLWPDNSPVLAGVIGLPPALGLALRMTSLRHLLQVVLPESVYGQLRNWRRAVRLAKRYMAAAARGVALLLWSVWPHAGN